MVLRCSQPFIIILPSSPYDLNNVERDVTHQPSLASAFSHSLFCCQLILHAPRPRGYKTFFMLNSAEREIFSANKYENANNSWHFHIY